MTEAQPLPYLRRATKTELELTKDGGSQRFPFSYLDAMQLVAEHQPDLEPRLADWLVAEADRRKEWKYECIKYDTELGEALAHRKFQREAVDFIMQNKVVLVADEAGLGKTLEAIAAVIESNVTGSILVVAPKTAAYVTWPAEMARWITEVAPYDEWVVIGSKLTKLERVQALKRVIRWDMGKDRIGPRQWVVVSPNYLRFQIKIDWRGNYVRDENGEKIIRTVREAQPALLAVDWAAIIVDECHQTLSGATGEVKDQSYQRQGLGLLTFQQNAMRIAMSGTPFRGKHENLWGTLNWLAPQDYKSYWGWVYTNFQVYQDYTGRRIVGELINPEAFAKSVHTLMIRRTKQEVTKELPRKLYGGVPLYPNRTGDHGPIAVWLDMFGTQKRTYEAMALAAMVELEGGTLMANGVLALMTRLKQFANSHGFLGGSNDVFYPNFPSNKFDWLVDFFADRGIDGKGPGDSKVLVASQFTKIINLYAKHLREKLSIPCYVLTGETNERDREIIVNEFQSGTRENGEPSPDVFLINTKAGGVSLTLDAADDVVIIDQTHTSDDQEQVENRVHRISRVHPVTVWYLASRGTIDESIARHTYKMDTSIKKILDGERGIDFARRLFRDAMG